jgi:CDP-4-dehydro-6-deoxyglucose reductase
MSWPGGKEGVWPGSAARKGAIVLLSRPMTPEVIEIAVRPEAPAGEPFRSGQYILVESGQDGPRAYSIASPPSQPTRLEFCIQVLPLGPGSRYMARLEAGDRLVYTGPHGSFVLARDSPRDLLFVATGTGIAPLRSMILDLLETGTPRRIDLLFGTRTEADLLYADSFRTLESRFPGFHYHPCLSRGGGAWPGLRGRVTTALPHLFSDLRGREAYLCGGSEMIRDGLDILTRLGMDPSLCHREEWY